jgi:hypothetical protein
MLEFDYLRKETVHKVKKIAHRSRAELAYAVGVAGPDEFCKTQYKILFTTVFDPVVQIQPAPMI